MTNKRTQKDMDKIMDYINSESGATWTCSREKGSATYTIRRAGEKLWDKLKYGEAHACLKVVAQFMYWTERNYIWKKIANVQIQRLADQLKECEGAREAANELEAELAVVNRNMVRMAEKCASFQDEIDNAVRVPSLARVEAVFHRGVTGHEPSYKKIQLWARILWAGFEQGYIVAIDKKDIAALVDARNITKKNRILSCHMVRKYAVQVQFALLLCQNGTVKYNNA